jgi:hypothetical protein
MTHRRRRLTVDAVQQLTLSTEPWLSCEDCFELMDVYVERILADPGTGGPTEMEVHLSGCAACAEEVQSLLDLVADQDGRASGPS